MLYADGAPYKTADGETVTATLSAANGWAASAGNLPKYRADGGRIAYEWRETAVPAGYIQAEGSPQTTAEGSVFSTVLANELQTLRAAVVKRWDDHDNYDHMRPASIQVVLLADGVRIAAETLSEANGWTAEVGDLSVYRLDEHGAAQPIDYQWVEEDLTDLGYEASYTPGVETAADGTVTAVTTTVTNTYTSRTSATVRKVWEDAENQDGKRPASLTVKLLRNGVEFGQSVTLSEANGWTAGIGELDVFDADGVPYVYTWQEPDVADYVLSGAAQEGTVTTFTNTHEPETTETTVEKIWTDDDDRDGLRPPRIFVTLSNGVSYELNQANGWKVTVTGLPKYRNGKLITYTWLTESDEQHLLDQYDKGQFILDPATGITSIRNTHEPEKVSVSAVKVWDDGDNQDGKRPDGVTVRLRKNGVPFGEPVALNGENAWSCRWDDLFKYEGGVEIVYDVIETSEAAEYVSVVKAVEGDQYAFTVTNTHAPDKTAYTVTKIWDDNDDQDGLRPATFTVQLLADGVPFGDPVTLSARDNSVSYTWQGLDKYRDGKLIVYSVQELAVDDYQTAFDPDTATLTNTHVPETISIPVIKRWDDNGDQDGLRPDRIGVQLLANGTPVASADLTAEGGWSHVWTELPRKSGGKDIIYEVQELSVEGYDTVVSGDAGTGFTISNQHTPQVTDLSIVKRWTGDEGNESLRDGVTVQLTADGVAIDTVTLSGDNGWTHVWQGMPVCADGRKIVYAVEETDAPEYYTVSVTQAAGTAATVFTVVNAFNPGTVSVTVNKSWLGDAANVPDVQVQLLADGAAQDSATLSAGNGWSHTWSGLPKMSGGRDIEYTVGEIAVPGYQPTVTPSGEDGHFVFDIVNMPTTRVAVRKIWDDEDDADGIRPEDIVIELLAGDAVVDSVTLTEGYLEHVFDGLPAVDAENNPIVYSVREANAPEGYAARIEGTAVIGFTITNTHEAGLGSLRIVKNVTIGGLPPAGLMSADGVYTFHVTGPNGYTATVPIAVIAGRGGQAVLRDLKPGQYTITEDVPEGMTLTSGNGIVVQVTAGNEADPPTATFVNNLNAVPTPTPVPAPTPTPVPTEPPAPTNPPTPVEPPAPTPTPVPTTSVSGEKVWDDESDAHGLRPDSVTIQLLADGVPVAATPTWSGTEGDRWSFTFTGLPAVDADGEPITYTVVETPVEGYTVMVSGTTIVNELIPRTPNEYTSIEGVKIWNDSGNADGTRPTYITVHLLQDGVEIASATVTAATNWQFRFDNLPVDDGYGHIYTYTIREETTPGFFTIVTGTTIVNGRIPDEPDYPPDTPDTPDTPPDDNPPDDNPPDTPDNPPDTPEDNPPYSPPAEPPRYRTPPEFNERSEEELEDLLDLFDYDTPLFGRPLGTGDEIPVYPFVFAGIGLAAVALLLALGRRRRKSGG